MRILQTLLRRYSEFLFNYPLVFLILTPIFLVFCAIFSFVPAVGPEMPDFSEPTKGFEPRGTAVMKRVVTREETLRVAVEKHEIFRCSPPGKRRRRSAASAPLQLCGADTYKYWSKMVTVYESGGDMMNVDVLKAVCTLEDRVVRKTAGFKPVCYKTYGTYECCPSLSLGNYIAYVQHKPSCFDITAEDVFFMNALLRNCSSRYFNGQLENLGRDPNSTDECATYRTVVEHVFKYLVDRDFMVSRDSLRNTIVVSPAEPTENTDFFRSVYEQHLEDGFPEQDGVKLVAFDFENFKEDQFNRQLLIDAKFPAIGLLFVALILLLYTHSVVVMLLTVFVVVTSLIIAYFIYHQIFRLTFFPFLNVTTFIFLVGIGADDAFVFTDVWLQAKQTKPGGQIVDWLEYTLKHAALSMFVTSFTTSSAFYANVVSDITAIRLFGIFAGTAILIKYALMITWFPAGVVMREKIAEKMAVNRNLKSEIHQNMALNDMHHTAVDTPPSSPPTPALQKNAGSPSPAEDRALASSQECIATDGPGVIGQPGRRARVCRCTFYERLRSTCSLFMTNLFSRWIPKCLCLYPLWLVALLALGIGMLCAVTVSPGLQRPKSSDFQMFSDSHALEQYELKYKKRFRISEEHRNNFWVTVYFGIEAVDNGNYFDPKDYGHLSFDTSLNFTSAKAQQWLVDLCSRIRGLSFFAKNASWSCLPETIQRECSEGDKHSFPFTKHTLETCITNNSFICHRLPCSFLFDRRRRVKGIEMNFPTNLRFSSDFKTADRMWDNVQKFENSKLDDAPAGLRNGWAISGLRFYALQNNLGSSTIASLGVSLAISFVVMLLTSMNWVISFYAILTIIFILSTTIGSLVLAGWELNILESIVTSVAVGLSVDFTLHYGVAYTIATGDGRSQQVKYALSHIGPAVTLAAVTTFIAGVFMMFSTVLAYFQLGQFLTLVMAVSWVYATFYFLSLCYFAGPVGHFGKINSKRCFSCKVSPDHESQLTNPTKSDT